MDNNLDEAFTIGFLKEANIDEPFGSSFIKDILKMPPKERKQAIQKKLQQWWKRTQQQIMFNLKDTIQEMKQEKVEEQASNFAEQMEEAKSPDK